MKALKFVQLSMNSQCEIAYMSIKQIPKKYYCINISGSILRYNWNIVESGVRHNKPTNNIYIIAIYPLAWLLITIC